MTKLEYTFKTDTLFKMLFVLRRLPSEINADNLLLLWLSLFKAETEEELKKIETLEVPVMKEAINAYHRCQVPKGRLTFFYVSSIIAPLHHHYEL